MGRKKLGNVLFARRVHPSKIPALTAAISGGVFPSNAGETIKPDNNVKALLDNIEELTIDVARLKFELAEARNLTDDEKTAYWRDRCLKCEKAKGNEYDQESS